MLNQKRISQRTIKIRASSKSLDDGVRKTNRSLATVLLLENDRRLPSPHGQQGPEAVD